MVNGWTLNTMCAEHFEIKQAKQNDDKGVRGE